MNPRDRRDQPTGRRASDEYIVVQLEELRRGQGQLVKRADEQAKAIAAIERDYISRSDLLEFRRDRRQDLSLAAIGFGVLATIVLHFV